ncbi:hypothetical protein E1B28_001675 [Marasmius oreades]|uniref:25S rRNA (uridine-N(3))-methyltransferase BMT5-like domain-containing protein n=1 Tax=Marasmius oreades TaxID=181124 RepID=A0A9P7V430_9AGAR|nr:uncharacterized protein E1B28_001675 [Marasmius oreades]KAG7099872.1 hypothetical protein E1B28_001675 [Marasmius oreades]
MAKGRGKPGKSLKVALQSQQSRFIAKERAAHAAEVAQAKEDRARGKKRKLDHQNPTPAKPKAGKDGEKGKSKAVEEIPKRPTIPFLPTDTILLVGEGNFSFARALVSCQSPLSSSSTPSSPSSSNASHDQHLSLVLLAQLPPNNVTATAYDTEEECYAKYPEASDVVKDLRSKGVEVVFGVDAAKLEVLAKRKGKGKGKELRKWDKVVWNFPHAGKGITDQDRNILSNQLLILGFLRSAAKVLKEGPVPDITSSTGKKRKRRDDDEDEDSDEEDLTHLPSAGSRGTVLITLRNVPPYTLWDVPKLAKNPPPPKQGSTPPNPKYTLLRSFAFYRGLWKGYEHRMTKGERVHGAGRTGEGGEDRTWEFCLKDTDEK